MFRPSHACALLLLLSAPALYAPPAQAQIRRCVAADGTHLYTDRACADIGASERLPRQHPQSAAGSPVRRDCSRRLQDLVFELTAAIDSRDVNRLAGVYHWPGTSSRSGYAIMARLDAIVNRPLVDISPLRPPAPEPLARPAPPQPTQLPSGVLVWRTPARTGAPPAPDAGTGADTGPATRRPEPGREAHAQGPPTGLVLDQTAANQATPLQTVFSLRRHLGCWWVSL